MEASNQRSVRFAGRGRDDDNFTYDGIDATNIVNQPQQPYVRLAIPLDTIQEFRVDSMLATAEAEAPGAAVRRDFALRHKSVSRRRFRVFSQQRVRCPAARPFTTAQQPLRSQSVRRLAGRPDRA